MTAVELRTAYRKEPIGIGEPSPVLSWCCEGGTTQTAYEINALCSGAPCWHSGIVESSAVQAVYGGTLHSRDRIDWQVRLRDENGAWGEWSAAASFEMGLLDKGDFCGKWLDPEPEHTLDKRQPASVLRKVFRCTPGKTARAYITAHGCYEAFLNGQRIGDWIFAPGTGEYGAFLPYQTYDITPLLKEEENILTVTVGDGWYRSAAGVEGTRCLFGEDIGLYLQLEVDGRAVCVTDETWKATQDGPIRESDLSQGEIYDANKEAPAAWHAVKAVDFDFGKLCCANALPVREHERFAGKKIVTPNGETVYDFGQNLAGYVELRCTAGGGETLTLTHGEALDENGNFTIANFQPGDRHKEGGIFQKVSYTCKPGKNSYKPHFSLFGFRYVKVEGALAELSDLALTSIAIYSDMEQLTEFSCGNEDVNQLFRNSVWSQKSNFCDVPTDCPTREKAGWTGDAGVFINTGLYLMDCRTVFEKWLRSCRVNQYPDGKVRNISPRNNAESFFGKLLAGSAGWGDAVVIVPYTIYKRYGDPKILADNYDMMCRWVGHLESRAAKGGLKGLFDRSPYKKYTVTSGIDYGEWCEPDLEMKQGIEQNGSGGTATAYLAYSSGLLAEIAGVLGKTDDAKRYAMPHENAKKAYQRAYTENGVIHSDRQKDYVRPLAFDLLEEADRPAAAAALDALVRKNDYHLNTGFLSTPYLCKVLTDYGYVETAYRLLLQEGAPGWLYAVKKGATTIWETWRGIDESGKVSASLNHYSYGAVCGWLIEDVCGIRYSADALTLAPKPCKLLGRAEATYRSPRGKIYSGWEYVGDSVKFTFRVPANVTAMVVLPDGSLKQIGSGVHHFECKENFQM